MSYDSPRWKRQLQERRKQLQAKVNELRQYEKELAEVETLLKTYGPLEEESVYRGPACGDACPGCDGCRRGMAYR